MRLTLLSRNGWYPRTSTHDDTFPHFFFFLPVLDCDSRLDSLTRENCAKGPGAKYYCQLCGKSRGDITAMRLHMEACHFPSARGYECGLCLRFCKTRHALQCHMSRYHKDRPVDFSTVAAQ
jgi:hypothetical protein